MWRDGLLLILQWLDNDSRIHVGRSSHYLLDAASTAIAWKNASPVEIPPQFLRIPRPISRLLQHATTKVHINHDSDEVSIEAIKAGGNQLHEITVKRYSSSVFKSFKAILEQLSQHIKKISLEDCEHFSYGILNSGIIKKDLPSLRAFRTTDYTDGCILAPQILLMTSLVDLEVAGSSNGDKLLQILQQAGFQPLKRLRVSRPTLHGTLFRSVLSASTFVGLEDLTLASWNANTAVVHDPKFGETFAAMDKLRSLQLINVKAVNLVIPHVHHAISLRQLTIGYSHGFSAAVNSSTLAFPDVLRQLLQSTPNRLLHITMDSPHSDGYMSSEKTRVYGQGFIHLTNLGPRLRIINSFPNH